MRRPIVLALPLLGLALGGCRHEHREITPTTLGTDLRRMPRGQMTPFAWPGQSIVKNSPAPRATETTGDPQTFTTSVETPGR